MPLTLDAIDRQSQYQPVWLITLADLQWVQEDFVQLDFVQHTLGAARRFATYDLDTLADPYYGRLLEPPVITHSLREVFYGVEEVAEVTFALANLDGALNQYFLTADARGTAVTIQKYDVRSGNLLTPFQGVITQVEWHLGKMVFHAMHEDVSILQQEIPKLRIETSVFPKAADAGVEVKVLFGTAVKVPLPYVNDDVPTNTYDYALPFDASGGTLTVTQLYRDGPGDGLYEQIDASEYAINTTAYPGYAVARFPVRQTNFANGFHKLYADVSAASVSQNFVRAIRTILSNTTWGLGRTVDATTFDAAEAQMDPVSGTAVTGLYCDGAILGKHEAQDVLKDLLAVRGMRLGLTPSGTVPAWTIAVDIEPTTYTEANDGAGDGPRTIVSIGPRVKPLLTDQISEYHLHYNLHPVTGVYQNGQSRTVSTVGKHLHYEHPYITNHTTADKVDHYLAQRAIYNADMCPMTLTQEARGITVGKIIRVTYAPLGYAAEDRQVSKVTLNETTVEIETVAWSANIYVYVAGTLPSNPALDSLSVETFSLSESFRGLNLRRYAARQVIFRADEIVLVETGITRKRAVRVNDWPDTIVDLNTSRALGLDEGTVAANAWYSFHAIRKADGTKSGLAHREKDYTLDQNINVPGSPVTVTWRNTSARQRIAQNFTPAIVGHRAFMVFRMGAGGTPAGDIWATIEADSAGSPSGTALATSDTVDAARLVGGSQPDVLLFFRTTTSLVAGTTYWVVLYSNVTIDGVNTVNVVGISGGTGTCKLYDGSVWAVNGGAQLYLREYVVGNDLPITMPTGYIQRARIGYGRTNASANIIRFTAVNRSVSAGEEQNSGSLTGNVVRILDWTAMIPPIPVIVDFSASGNVVGGFLTIGGINDGHGGSFYTGQRLTVTLNVNDNTRPTIPMGRVKTEAYQRLYFFQDNAPIAWHQGYEW